MVTPQQRLFIDTRRIAHLATADGDGVPHVVQVCFVLAEDRLYITIDGKPKQHGRPLKRLRNIAENPRAAIVFDRYDEDWRRLGWVMLHGPAGILASGPEHDHAQARLRIRYPQLGAMQISDLPVIAIAVEKAASWGDLAA